MSGRNSQINRLFRVYSLIEGSTQGLTATEIFDRVKDDYPVNRRSILRDIAGLGAAGFAVYEETDPSDKRIIRWKADRTVKVTKTLIFTPRELVGLYLARHALAPFKETPLFEDLDRAFKKIEGVLGEKAMDYLREVSAGIVFEPGPRWALGIDSDVIDTVRSCCEEGQLLSVVYRSQNSGETKKRVLGPQFLYFAQGSVYLVAEDIDAGRVKVFSIPRMSEAEMLDEPYHGVRVNPEVFFEKSFSVFQGAVSERVSLVFSSAISEYIRERRWHHSQQVKLLESGGAEMSLEVSITPELLNWVLGFGANVRVQSPASLVESVRSAAASVLALYDDDEAA